MKKIKLLALTALLSATAVISACTATAEQCDPSIELDVFSKAACKFSGSYDQRIEQKEKILLNEQIKFIIINMNMFVKVIKIVNLKL